jgi:hypothetical protein
MNLSDLLHADVVDCNDEGVGAIDDVRVVQDGPLLAPFGAALRIEGLAVGHRALGRRLGYGHGGIRGPWLLRIILARLSARSYYVDWTDVEEWDGKRVRLRVPVGALRSLNDAP